MLITLPHYVLVENGGPLAPNAAICPLGRVPLGRRSLPFLTSSNTDLTEITLQLYLLGEKQTFAICLSDGGNLNLREPRLLYHSAQETRPQLNWRESA